MEPFDVTFASFIIILLLLLKSLMLVAIHCHYMDKHEQDIFFKFPFCGPKRKKGYTTLEQHQDE